MIDCVHHWIFETPTGPTSVGVCKKCGKKQQAENHMDIPLLSSYKMKAMRKKKKMETPLPEKCS